MVQARRSRAQKVQKETQMVIEEVESVVQSGRREATEESNISVMALIPIALKVQAEKFAKDNKTSVGALIRDVLAERLGYTLPLTVKKSSRKSKTEAQIKEENRIRGQEQRAMLRAMLARVRAAEGVEDEDEDDEDEDEEDEA